MTILLEPVSKDKQWLELPNGFWAAFCIETPISQILNCSYKDDSKFVIKYKHEGYIGAWIPEELTVEMLNLLLTYIKTTDYKNHRYFSEVYPEGYGDLTNTPIRHSQMINMIDFLKDCKGFRKTH